MKYAKLAGLIVALSLLWFAAGLTRRNNASVIRLPRPGTVTEVSIDLGEVYSGQDVGAKLPVANKSGSPALLHAESECACAKVELERQALAAGESTSIDIRYRSSLRPARLGKAQERFIIADVSNAQSVTKAVGVLNVFVKPSVTFAPTHLEWHLGPNGPEPSQRQLTVKNETPNSMVLRWRPSRDADETSFVYSVTPPELVLAPGMQSAFTIAAIRLADTQPFAGNVEFISEFRDGSKSVKIVHKYPVRILPRSIVSALPGSLIFSEAELNAGAAKTLKLHTNSGKPIAVKSVASRDRLITIARQPDNTYLVSPAQSPPPRTLSDALQIDYEVEGVPGRLTVPGLGIAR